MNLETHNLTVAIHGKLLVEDLNLTIPPGELICLLGTNGVGKTLTLHTLAGLLDASKGTVKIGGETLDALPRKEAARRIGLLLQIHEDAFPQTVTESALLGRYPHLGTWQWPDANDHELVNDALASFDLKDLGDRALTQLSGGERKRVALATLKAQNPAIWLLDEPLNHLDPQHQLSVMRLLRDHARQGHGILASLHNPGLARRFADQALLLFGNGEWEFGPVDEILEPERMERLYNTPFEFFRHDDQVTLLPV
ncbi:MAG: ABC transporter ATP-binding protein [Gammaproteobacteria bacterium]